MNMRSTFKGDQQDLSDEKPYSGDIGRWSSLIAAVEALTSVSSLEDVIEILRATARGIVSSDGIAIVLREGSLCYYVAEDACAPLWAGQRFPGETCVSGWAMRERKTVVIPDIECDPRVPIDAYRATFVRSMVMVPIGLPEPIAAVGAYWADVRMPEEDEIAMLEAFARAAATALENARLIGSLKALNDGLEIRIAERTAELERTHEVLRQTQKLEVVGKLTGNVAHDFNNLLTPIISSIELVMHRGMSDDRAAHTLSRAMEAAERAQILVQRLLSFARRQPLRPTAIDLIALVDGMAGLLASTLGPRIRLTIDMPPDLPHIRADANQLEMAILNLVINARDAMADGGTLKLWATKLSRGDHRLVDAPPGDFISFSIRDSGVGMDNETIERAIEPFFSTKGVGQGTGLGLSMVDGLTAQLGGRLAITSQPGIGTTITLLLPQAGEAASDEPDEEGDAFPTAKARGTVLLIDDDELVRAGTSEMLLELGFEVLEAATADQGLALINSGFRLSAIVTDHLMPGMTGAELARKLKDERPELPVLLISGFQNMESVAPDIPRLSKPFRHAQLGASIASLLGEGSLH